jgi:hypothetical protein
LLDLLLERKQSGLRSELIVTVSMRPEQDERRAQEADWRTWCAQVARELRAYLISR